jgi:putative oxidoreductase
MKFIPLLGRILFALIFLMSSFGHFSAESIGYAASKGVPAASFLVPFSGVLELLGAISIILGYRAKLGGWLIVAFLVPVNFMMHQFWTIADPVMQQMDMIMFMKNLGLTGAALLIAYFGAGPLSLDNRARKAIVAA